MAQLETRDHYLIAALLHQRIKPLRPLENPAHVEPFNELRGLAARLTGLIEDDARTGGGIDFDPQRFIQLVMRGEAS